MKYGLFGKSKDDLNVVTQVDLNRFLWKLMATSSMNVET